VSLNDCGVGPGPSFGAEPLPGSPRHWGGVKFVLRGDDMPVKPAEGLQSVKAASIAVPVRLWARKRGDWIQIRLVAPGQPPVWITNDPLSRRYHRILFRNLRKTLLEHGAWPSDDKPSEPVPRGATEEATDTQEASSRFQPIRALGGAMASSIILQDRERF
jgi:hypothetical protein